METFKITFTTNDGNENTILVDAANERKALQIFETEYSFDAVISVQRNNEILNEPENMTVAQVRRLLFDSNKYAVIGENEMTNGEARAYLYEMPNQEEILSVIDMGDHVLVTELKKELH
jgi:hypothetical protein